MLASFPVSMLKQKPSDLGILNRFKLVPSRGLARLHALDPEVSATGFGRPDCAIGGLAQATRDSLHRIWICEGRFRFSNADARACSTPSILGISIYPNSGSPGPGFTPRPSAN